MSQLAALSPGPARFAIRRATAGDVPAIVGFTATHEGFKLPL